jgi:hypothetical protein
MLCWKAQTQEMKMQVFVRDVEVAIGQDPEEGHVRFGVRYFLVAEDDKGYRWVHEKAFPDEAAANAFEVVVAAALAAGRALDLDHHWSETYPAYGSAAYQAEDAGGVFAHMEKMADQDGVHRFNDISHVA